MEKNCRKNNEQTTKKGILFRVYIFSASSCTTLCNRIVNGNNSALFKL